MPSCSPRAPTRITLPSTSHGVVAGTGSSSRTRVDSPTICRSGPGSGFLQPSGIAHVTVRHAATKALTLLAPCTGSAPGASVVSSCFVEPTPIVAFAKDWHEDPTSNHHVLRELAKTRRVLWLNSLATRTPKLSSGRDLGKIKRKLREFAAGPQNVENDLWVMSPLVLPLPHSSVARAINRQLLRATIRGLRMKLGIKEFQLWTFLPNVADY